MKSFSGFPAKREVTPLPNLFLSSLLPQIEDIAELKCTLHIFWMLSQRRPYPRFVTLGELLGDKTLMTGMGMGGDNPAEALHRGLELAVKRGTFLCLSLEKGGEVWNLYFLNTDADREAMAKIEAGEIALGALPRPEPYREKVERANIFALYEENIGMLTPMIAEELQDAERLFPEEWIEAAFREAVSLNKRSWRYILRILERWAAEGRGHGEFGRDSKEDPDKYIKGRFGHIVRR